MNERKQTNDQLSRQCMVCRPAALGSLRRRKLSAVSELLPLRHRPRRPPRQTPSTMSNAPSRRRIPDRRARHRQTATHLRRRRSPLPRLTALVYALFFTGSRISEILGADIRDYRHDHGHRVLRIRRKGGKIASAALPPPAVRLIRMQRLPLLLLAAEATRGASSGWRYRS